MKRNLMAAILAVCLLLAMTGCGAWTEATPAPTPIVLDESATYFADIEIKGYGTVTVQMDQHAAPVTVTNFLNLANVGYYDGLTFHRIIKGFMMQGGSPTSVETMSNSIVGEFAANGYNNPISHTRGVISMARGQDYNSANSQFFIMHKDSPGLNGGYAAFGYVTEGMEVVDAICEAARPIDNNGIIAAEERPVITKITVRVE